MKKKILEKCYHLFFNISSVFLFFTAAFKIISLLSAENYLSNPDPLFSFVPLFFTLLLASVLEIGVGCLLLLLDSIMNKAILILWLSILFIGYRFGLLYYRLSWYDCNCMGTLSKWSGLSEKTVSIFSLSLLAFLFLGSLLVIISRIFKK